MKQRRISHQGLRQRIDLAVSEAISGVGQGGNLPVMHWQLALHLEIDVEGWPQHGTPTEREKAARVWARHLGIQQLGDEPYYEGLVDGLNVAIGADPLEDRHADETPKLHPH